MSEKKHRFRIEIQTDIAIDRSSILSDPLIELLKGETTIIISDITNNKVSNITSYNGNLSTEESEDDICEEDY